MFIVGIGLGYGLAWLRAREARLDAEYLIAKLEEELVRLDNENMILSAEKANPWVME